MKTDKKLFLISASAIFLIASVFIVGWIVRDQKKGGAEKVTVSRQEEEFSQENEKEKVEVVVVTNKKEAEKAVSDMDSVIDSMGNDLN